MGREGTTVYEIRVMFHCIRTKIPDPPIHFSGTTNVFDSKNEFTNHQLETSVLDPIMSSDPLSVVRESQPATAFVSF